MKKVCCLCVRISTIPSEESVEAVTVSDKIETFVSCKYHTTIERTIKLIGYKMVMEWNCRRIF